jgi:hypothetical protein
MNLSNILYVEAYLGSPNFDCYSYSYIDNEGNEQKKDVTLDENDFVWVKLRHMHIADAINFITEDFNQFLKDNQKIATLDNHGRVSIAICVRGLITHSYTTIFLFVIGWDTKRNERGSEINA